MLLKKGLNWRLHPDDSVITFYNGQENELRASDIESLWELLMMLSSEECSEEKIVKWRNEYDYTEEDFKNTINFFIDNGLVYEESPLNSTAINKRNFNYFSVYDSSNHADSIIRKINNTGEYI